MTSQPTVNVRRHNSFPGRVRRSTPALQRMSDHMKFNPYLGYLRHSPDTSSVSGTKNAAKLKQMEIYPSAKSGTSSYQSTYSSCIKTMPASPYLGYLRHSPTMLMLKMVEAELLTFIKITLPAMKATCDHVQELADFLAGRLRGGSPSWYCNDKYKGSYAVKHGSHAALKAHLLNRIAGWVLAPFLCNDDNEGYQSHSSSSLKSLDNESLTTVDENDLGRLDEDEEDSAYSDEDHDYDGTERTTSENNDPDVLRRCQRSNSVESSSSAMQGAVSSQAEAYYAHQAARELNPDDVIPRRLDYVITQMDILRMQRNASRHLDVNSIYQLPTITYRNNNPNISSSQERSKGGKKKTNDTRSTSEGWSWMLVSHATAAGSQQDGRNTNDYDEEDVCVICLEHYAYGDRLRVLPCNHSFHVGCIDRWLSGSASFDECHTAGCPTCKKRPVVEQEENDQEQERLEELRPDGSVPSWAFSQLGSALLERDSQQH